MADNNKTKINRGVRFWNRHKGSVLTGVLVLLVALIALLVVQLIEKPGDNNKPSEDTTTRPTQVLQNDSTQAATQEPSTNKLVNPDDVINASTKEPTTAAPTQAPTTSGNVINVTNKYVKESYTSAAFYADAVFVGDGIASGVTAYRLLADSKYIGDSSMSTLNATTYVDKIVAAKPAKVFISLGLNDINFNTRTGAQIASAYSSFVAQIKAKLPSAKIYVISVLPVNEALWKSNVTNAKVKDLNANLATMCNNLGVKYVDINGSFADSNGNLTSEVTTSGYTISSAAYAFFLNTISKVAQ